jgi:hypothetical protein
MLELLAYLRANGFKTFIVSGGGVEFVRAFAERIYGIPPEQVVGIRGEAEVRAARRPTAGYRVTTTMVAPDADIAHGYEGTELRTVDGLVIQGLLIKQGIR